VTDLAMYTREQAVSAQVAITELMTVLLRRAEEHVDWPMPGYTHLQRAQPVYLGHHLLAYFWMLVRDRRRFHFAERESGRLPLGAGALAGVNFDTDRRQVMTELGFSDIAANSIDAVSGRDFVLDYLGAAATCSTHLSRLGAELVLWCSEEFSFCTLPDAWTSGSSIMPQKKNPDAAELLRAKAPRMVGHLAAFHGVMHALPLTYNKDLQEDKEHLFDAVDTLELTLSAARGMVDGVTFDRERLQQAAGDEMIAATDIADLLVKGGVPFREAHVVMAGLVRTAVDSGRTLSDFSREELAAHSETLATHGEDYYEVLKQDSWLESKISQGGTSSARLREQIDVARRALGDGAHA
jgi:argininosuccinate lyase